jgi:hypothetical protein
MVAASSVNLKQKFRFLSIVSQHSQPPPRAHTHQSQASKKARHQAGL